ncbi:MAG: hypothetical protein DA405_02000 [Bacteroidetes bacterium]|nr:MAG: hypothetical protein DA405_02000 [Bacteroidota bacterium]
MNIKPTKREYIGDEVTIIWQAHKCIHSEKCWRSLGEVFRYGQKPWVDPNGASGEGIRKQIDQCPSAALSYVGQEKAELVSEGDLNATLVPNGPIIVKGAIKFTHPDGSSSIEENPVLCRCGASGKKPFCDGSHKKIGFEAS